VINASQVSRGLDIASDDVEVRPNGFAGVEVVGSDNVVGGPDPKDRRGLLGAAAIAAFVAIAGSPL
jgi:hypothetical protein